jgi:hypothetical protein
MEETLNETLSIFRGSKKRGIVSMKASYKSRFGHKKAFETHLSEAEEK